MISETTFMGCDNLPEAMAGRFDLPWHFVGEVKADLPWIAYPCDHCNGREVRFSPEPLCYDPVVVVTLDGRLFVTDDFIEVTIYFGICSKCESIYWARSGPPFRRIRACVTA